MLYRPHFIRSIRTVALVCAIALPVTGCATFQNMFSFLDFGSKEAPAEVAVVPPPNPAPVITTEASAAKAKPVIMAAATAAPVSEATGSISASGPTPVDAQAKGYEAFARDVDEIANMKLNTPKQVRAALARLQKHEPSTVSDGWVAYAARAVALNKEFGKTIDKEVADRGLKTVVDKIANDPKYLARLSGAYEALDGLMKQVAADTGKLDQLGERFMSTAYAFQKNKQFGALERRAPAGAEALDGNVVPAFFGKKSKPVEPADLSRRVLQLAAQLNAGGLKDSAANALAHDKSLEQCLRWAKLNLNQCAAAAYFPSEEAYCAGKHGINEVSACWSKLLPTRS